MSRRILLCPPDTPTCPSCGRDLSATDCYSPCRSLRRCWEIGKGSGSQQPGCGQWLIVRDALVVTAVTSRAFWRIMYDPAPLGDLLDEACPLSRGLL